VSSITRYCSKQPNGQTELERAASNLVCVVDDDQSVRRSLRRLFKSAGYAAEMFASAEDYLARETFAGPICLVLDVRMPGLNGLDLQQALESRGAG
jgi:FixJ family two-component response regulator